ncbi:hypothetical protein RT723_03090 [Psychrosphaera aquimarina]|uniref:Pyrimidine nucleoside phosphorylase C-terminal domain-containing protein n=1 Tax=Psychrosphaera aquimarina TaxID=2044854 RepID=A0ABU3QX63_9GAMM|nr:hypothetical protein [Psychrosphaera aquimarina]MDU0112003.1 hypothetical protein [Psychrosphaera aquimarina]
MNQVLGVTAGNALEMYETVQYLTGEYLDPRLHAVVKSLATAMLVNSGLALDTASAEKQIIRALDSGSAAEIFEKMVAALGGPTDYLANPWSSMQKANVVVDIKATQAGYLSQMNTRDIGMSVVGLGGGRTAPGQLVDHTVGFDAILPLGVQVSVGDVIARVHAKDADAAKVAAEQYNNALSFSDKKPNLSPVIYS